MSKYFNIFIENIGILQSYNIPQSQVFCRKKRMRIKPGEVAARRLSHLEKILQSVRDDSVFVLGSFRARQPLGL